MRNLTGKYSRKPPVRAVIPSKNEEKNISSNGSVASDDLRADLFAHSQTFPEDNLFTRPNVQRIIALLVVFAVIAGSTWFCFIGPGAPTLEANLKRLAQQASLPAALTYTPLQTPTLTPSPTQLLSIPTRVPFTPTSVNSPTPTSTATETSTPTVEPSPTPVPLENTPTPTSEVSGCVQASEVTLADVGKILCVSGRVFRTIDKPASFIIIVVEEPGAFYFVAYDLKYNKLEKKQCIYANGEIRQLGDNPIMVVSYSVPIQYCP